MKTMGNLLAAQTQMKRGPDELAVKSITDILMKATDPDGVEYTEFHKGVPNKAVVAPAIFSMRYLYPNHAAFEQHHRKVAQRLLDLLKRKKTDRPNSPPMLPDDLRALVAETMYFITQQPYGDNIDRWDRWMDRKYPGFKKPK